ncbi:hypothetical protein, partial [Pseudomonas syringae]|uniref:hypothetical protein n=6 Tax=Pseudomonas syringae TaxID=317 RepID=UPI000C478FE6
RILAAIEAPGKGYVFQGQGHRGKVSPAPAFQLFDFTDADPLGAHWRSTDGRLAATTHKNGPYAIVERRGQFEIAPVMDISTAYRPWKGTGTVRLSAR